MKFDCQCEHITYLKKYNGHLRGCKYSDNKYHMSKEQTVEELRSHLLMCDMPIDEINPALEILKEAQETARREERERVCKDLDEMWTSLYGAYLNNQDLRELIKDLVTTNNN